MDRKTIVGLLIASAGCVVLLTLATRVLRGGNHAASTAHPSRLAAHSLVGHPTSTGPLNPHHAVASHPTAAGSDSPAGGAFQSDAAENGVGVFELTLPYPTDALPNAWESATVSATFTAPSGTTTRVNGFYYDRGAYKVRFAPSEPGTYQYVATINGPTDVPPVAGTFEAPATAAKGFVRVSPRDSTRLVFDDGSFFNALGLNDCWGKDPAQEDRLGQRNFIAAGEAVDADTYFATYAQAGFNLLRWDSGNCSFPVGASLSGSGNTYSTIDGKLADQLLQSATRNGFRVMLGAFMDPDYPDAADHPDEQQAVQRYLDYLVARYGAYTDIWELTNETSPSDLPDSWLRFAAAYLHAHDPYHHLVTNSYPRDGDWTYLDLRSPHSYLQSTPQNADRDYASDVSQYKDGNLPIVFGEAGNETCNWDQTSALRLRLRLWSTFFSAGELVFWNSSGNKVYCPNGAANAYLGPEERGYTRVFQEFTRDLDLPAQMVTIEASGAGVRGYGLRSPTMFLAYLHHFSSHSATISTQINVDVPVRGTATWIDPATGQTIATQPVDPGPQSLTSPPFTIDLVLRIRP